MEEKTLSKSMRVDEDSLALTVGSGSLAVLATPSVIALMEGAAAELAQGELENEDYTTVGTMISVAHISPTPINAEVTATARLKECDGRSFKFDVWAEDKAGRIAEGTHTRVRVNAEKFQQKADEKFDA